MNKFSELVDHRQIYSCSTCDTHEYILPQPLSREIERFLVEFGELRYPLDKVAIVKIDSDDVSLQARLGRTHIRVKFKRNKELRKAFEAQLASYLGLMMQTQISLD